jgi:UDP-N-acetylglucosamine 4,6-dehydratase/5-epimerase
LRIQDGGNGTLFDQKKILVTGGTGSFGQSFIRHMLMMYKPSDLIVFSRDELKQFEMREEFPTDETPVRYLLGDIRDKERLFQACHKVDYIVHAAALKQVPTIEFNPFEAVKTNILGSENVIQAALENGVKRIIALSTDKACSPINLYGATKLAADKLFAAANHWQGAGGSQFSVVRYGNVIGSRGSVIPFFQKKKSEGRLPVTDDRMTRFWITLEQAVKFVFSSFARMNGGELFVPKIPSMSILDLAKAIAPNADIDIVGIRPGEKLHEIMISDDDAVNTLEYENHFVVQPAQPWWDRPRFQRQTGGEEVSDKFRYSSDKNPQWLTVSDLRVLLKKA